MDRSQFQDKNGKNITVGLFKEWARPDVKFKPVYSLPKVKEMFLAAKDPSEYKAAMSIVGDWEHWQEIRNHPYIKPYVEKWLEELAVLLRSEAIAAMQAHARAPGGTAAAKWLADKGYLGELPEKKKVGRPVKEEVEEDNSKVESKLAPVLSIIGKASNG